MKKIRKRDNYKSNKLLHKRAQAFHIEGNKCLKIF